MIRFYRKNEMLFSIICIVIYVVVFGSLRNLGDDNPYTTAGLAAMSVALLMFALRNGLADKFGLSSWATNQRGLLYLVPLWVITTSNLWGGIEPHYEGVGLACAVATMTLVGVVEEFVFRGLLFNAMLKDSSETTAIVVSSVTFGTGHIVNLLTGHATLEVGIQIVFAVALGFVFTLVYHKGGSLLPCIVAHSLIDVFSVFSAATGIVDWISVAVCIAIAVAYSAYLWKQRAA